MIAPNHPGLCFRGASDGRVFVHDGVAWNRLNVRGSEFRYCWGICSGRRDRELLAFDLLERVVGPDDAFVFAPLFARRVVQTWQAPTFRATESRIRAFVRDWKARTDRSAGLATLQRKLNATKSGRLRNPFSVQMRTASPVAISRHAGE